MNRPGFTILELLVIMVIMVIITAAVLGVLNHTCSQSMLITEQMARQGAIQHCLNLIVDDITAADTKHSKIEIDRHTLADGRETAHLTILTFNRPEELDPEFQWDRPDALQSLQRAQSSPYKEPDVRVDWVAVPRFEENDLVLFRREQSLSAETELYIPLCENISSFRVVRLSPQGQPSLDSELPLIEISARIYRPGPPDPQRVFTARRTFCSHRFIGPRPVDVR